MKEQDISDLAFLSEAIVRTSKNKKSRAQAKKMRREIQNNLLNKKPKLKNVLNEIESAIDKALVKSDKSNQHNSLSGRIDNLIKNKDKDKNMAGHTLQWNVMNLKSQNKKKEHKSHSSYFMK